MQTSCLPFRARTLSLAAFLLCVTFVAARAAQTPPATSGKAPATTKVAPVEPEPPKSVFRVPASSQEGRDPFFPLSSLRTSQVSPSKPPAAAAPAELELKGISGSADHRLAIINNRTFEPGEEGTVLSNVGRVRITCKEIGADSVRVILNGQERTLTLRPH